jgi:hypothetical protein
VYLDVEQDWQDIAEIVDGAFAITRESRRSKA